MKVLPLATVITVFATSILSASAAESTQQQIAELKRRIEALEQQQHEEQPGTVRWSGALELEALYEKQYDENSTSDLQVATAYLAAESRLQPNLLAAVSFLYEENETSLEIDEAYLSYGMSEQFAITVGQLYLPFGQFRTSVISDPLTLELGETRETAAMITYKQDQLTVKGYIFRGNSSASTDTIESGGIRGASGFRYADGKGFVSFDFISNLLDSSSLSATGIDFDDKAEAMAAAFYWQNGIWGTSMEYMTALFDIDSETPGLVDDKKPAAIQLECFYNDTVKNHNVTLAASVQQTRDALLIGLPERRWAVSVAVPLRSDLAVSAQLYADEDYGQSDSVAGTRGTGDTAKGVLFQIAAEIQ